MTHRKKGRPYGTSRAALSRRRLSGEAATLSARPRAGDRTLDALCRILDPVTCEKREPTERELDTARKIIAILDDTTVNEAAMVLLFCVATLGERLHPIGSTSETKGE